MYVLNIQVLMQSGIILNFHRGDERVAHRATMGTRLTSLDAPTARGGGEASRGCWGAVPGCWEGVFRFYLNLSSRSN